MFMEHGYADSRDVHLADLRDRLRAIERELETLQYERIALNNRKFPRTEWHDGHVQGRLRAIAERVRLLEVEHEAIRAEQEAACQ